MSYDCCQLKLFLDNPLHSILCFPYRVFLTCFQAARKTMTFINHTLALRPLRVDRGFVRSQPADIRSHRANVYPQAANLYSHGANRDLFRLRTSLLFATNGFIL